jgi:PAS domain S-box-containing protein
LGIQNPYHTLWLAVVFTAWYCGVGPSIACVLLGILGVWYLFLPPLNTFAIPDRSQLFGMFGFLLFSGAIIALGESNRSGSAAQNRLGAIVESSDDAIISKNLDGVIISWNSSAERLFGYTAQEAVGQAITLIIPEDRRDEEAGILARVRRGERIDHFETLRRRKDGQLLDISLTISPVKDSSDRVIGASKVARDITASKRAQNAAEEAIREREISARLLQLQDEDRRRVARELHDGVGQLLTAMSMNASLLSTEKGSLSPEAARCATENEALVQEAIAEIRTISYLLHPPLLDEMGLHSALRWYVDGFAERSKIAAKLELPAEAERLSQEQELCIFRMAQECLTNIHRHSGASAAVVRLELTPQRVTLEVSDNGKGIDREVRSRIISRGGSGVGLRGMRERFRQLGGTLEIISDGKGTTISGALPRIDAARAQDLDRGATAGAASPC